MAIGLLTCVIVIAITWRSLHILQNNLLRPMITIDNVIIEDYPPLQPDVQDDFPTVPGNVPIIPHILHQTYKTASIPSDFVPFVQSFVNHNPNWTYMFWSDESAKQLIADKHPYLLPLWNNYNKNINRADVLRYVVLYEYGGVYADLDFEFFRPLDIVTYKYACIFPPEPFEHAVFRLKIPFLISNAIMMCRPKHPFLKQMLEQLQYYFHMVEQIDTAGPAFITSQFMIYNNITGGQAFDFKLDKDSNSPYFYKGHLAEDDENAVYVPNTRYFMDTLDTHFPSKETYDQLCSDLTPLNMLTRRMCVDYIRRGFSRAKDPYTFSQHHWYQSYFRKEPFDYMASIFSIVPFCKMYEENVNRNK